MRLAPFFALALVACSNSGLGRDASGFEADFQLLERTADEEAGMVAFLNDHEVSTFGILDGMCLLRSDSAGNIDAFRRGQDGKYGVGHDGVFTDEQSVLDIYMVGPWTVDQLYRCAELHGYIEPTCSAPGATTEWIDGSSDWHAALPASVVGVVQDLLDTPDHCGPSMYAVVLAGVTVHRTDCQTTGYTVEMVQMLDPEGGIQYLIDAELDSVGFVTDVYCSI